LGQNRPPALSNTPQRGSKCSLVRKLVPETFILLLGGHMETEHLHIFLIPAPDDDPLYSAEYQEQLRAFLAYLKSHGLKPGVQIRSIDAAWEPGQLGFNVAKLVGEFGVPVARGLGAILTAAIGAWLHAKYGRKVRLEIGKNGGIKAEAQTVEEVETLVRLAEKHATKKHARKRKHKS
jgi:hypothetical protein